MCVYVDEGYHSECSGKPPTAQSKLAYSCPCYEYMLQERIGGKKSIDRGKRVDWRREERKGKEMR